MQNYNIYWKEQKKIAKIFHINTFAIQFVGFIYSFCSFILLEKGIPSCKKTILDDRRTISSF